MAAISQMCPATRRCALLVKSHEAGRSSVEILVGECSLYSNYLVQPSFLFGVGTAFPFLSESSIRLDAENQTVKQVYSILSIGYAHFPGFSNIHS